MNKSELTAKIIETKNELLEKIGETSQELLDLLEVYNNHFVADEELSDLISKVIEALS